MALDGSFVVAWMDMPYREDNIYAQRYNSSGQRLGSNFVVNDEYTPSIKYSLSLDVFPDGGFVIAWEDGRDGNRSIFARVYDLDGTPMGKNFRVNDDTLNGGKYAPTVAVSSDGSFAIAWTDYRNGRCNADVYAQQFDAGGMVVGDNFRVNNEARETYQGTPVIGMDDNKNLYVCWRDNRIPDHVHDIYAKIIDWEETSVSPTEISGPLPSDFSLCQNFPNPFNATTNIRYALPGGDRMVPLHTTLKIYNILGQEVWTLVDEQQDAGLYLITWNGRDNRDNGVPSGIYFYQLLVNGGQWSETRKMLSLR